MISPLAEPRSATGPHISQLRRQLRLQGQYPVDWLVIAHNDLPLLQRLADALADTSAVLLPLSQAAWNKEEETLPDIVEWAVHEAGVNSIVLVAHSQAAAHPTRAAIASEGDRDATSHRHTKRTRSTPLFRRVAHGQDHLQRVKQQLAEQVIRLTENEQMSQQYSESTPSVHGLLYLAESDSFLVFEAKTREFRRLGETIFDGQAVTEPIDQT